MSRVPIFTDPGTSSPASPNIPSGQFGQPALGNVPIRSPGRGGVSGLAIAAASLSKALEQMGRRRIRAYRARTLTEVETNAMLAVAEAEGEAFKADPAEAERTYEASQKLGEARAQVDAITDEFIRADANAIFERVKARGLIRVGGSARRREVQEGRAAVMRSRDTYLAQIADNKLTAAEAFAQFKQTFEMHSEAFNPEDTELFLSATKELFYKEHATLLLNGTETIPPTPEAVKPLLQSDDAITALSPSERRTLNNLADSKVQEQQQEVFISTLSMARQEISAELADDASNTDDFRVTVENLSNDIIALVEEAKKQGFGNVRVGGRDILSSRDVTNYLLTHTDGPMEAAARSGDYDRFQIVVSALPGGKVDKHGVATVTGNALGESKTGQFRAILIGVLSNQNKADRVDAEVADAILHLTRVPKTDAHKAALDALAAERVLQLTQDAQEGGGEPLTLDRLGIQLIDEFGPTGYLPQRITDQLTAIVGNPASFSTDDIGGAMSLMSYARRGSPAIHDAYIDSIPQDIRRVGMLFEKLHVPGADPRETITTAIKAYNPIDVATAIGVKMNRQVIVDQAMSELAKLIKGSSQFDLNVEGDFQKTKLGNMDLDSGEFLTFDELSIGDTVPPDLVTKYITRVFINRTSGMSPDASIIDAFQHIEQASYAKSTAFGDSVNPVIRILEVVRHNRYPSVEAFEHDMSNLILNALSSGVLITPIAMSDEGEASIPRWDVGGTSDPPLPTFLPPTATKPFDRSRPNTQTLEQIFKLKIDKEFAHSGIEPEGRERVEDDMAALRGANMRVFREDLRDKVIRWSKTGENGRLRFIPEGNENEGLVFKGTDGQNKTIYGIYYVDNDGFQHPFMARGPDGNIERFFIYPDPAIGLTAMQTSLEQGVQQQKNLRNYRLRKEHIELMRQLNIVRPPTDQLRRPARPGQATREP